MAANLVDHQTVTVAAGVVPNATFANVAVGNYELKAVYSGDPATFNLGAKSDCGTEPFTVNNKPAITTTVVTTSPQVAPASITDSAALTGLNDPTHAAGTVTYNLYTGSDNTVCVAANLVDHQTVTVAAGVVPNATFANVAAGNYELQAVYSGDPATFNLGAKSDCGTEPFTVTAPPSAEITPTNTTCQQFSSGTASTLSAFNYAGTTTISSENPGVFFYYDKATVAAGTHTITVQESITSNNTFPSGESKYLLRVLNDSANQVQLFDANCNPISGETITVGPVDPATNTYTVTITTPSTLAKGDYIFSVKYTPKTLTGLAVPSPTTIVYSFSSAVDAVPVPGSTQSISGIKS